MPKLSKAKHVIASLSAAMLMACGGGGSDGSSGRSSENITYITSNGLIWSSPSNATYIYQGSFSSSETDAFAYCSRTTSTNGGPSIPSNFNNEAGWDVPTEDQILAFRAANLTATGWSAVDIWFQHGSNYSGNLNTYIMYGTGIVGYANIAAKAHVVCVKPV